MSPRRKPTLPIDVYTRVSRTGGRDVEREGGTAEVQERRCRAQLEADGLALGIAHAPDLDESGGKASRPSWDAVMKRIRSGESGGVIVAKLNRAGRRVKHLLADIAEIEEHGAVFISCEEKLDTSTPIGRFTLTVLSALAELELDQRTEEWAEVYGRLIGKGAHFSPTCAFGYVPVLDERGKRAGLALDPERAPHAREVFLRRARGATWRELFEYLNAHVDPRPFAQPSGVREMVRSKVYTGTAFHGERETPNAHPAIVSVREWEAANAVNGVRPSNGEGDGELLRGGLVRCACCRGTMAPDYRTWRRKDGSRGRVPVYRCRNAACSERASVSFARVEPYVEARALEAIRQTQRQLDEESAELASWLDVLREADDESSLRFWNVLPVPAKRKLIGGTLGAIYVTRGDGPVEERARFTV